MFIGEEYKEIVEKKFAEAIANGQTEILLDEKTIGGIKLFIGTKPAISMGTFVMEDGTEVHVGAQSLETVS